MKVGFRLHHTHTLSLSLTRCIGVSGSNSIGTMMQNEKYGHGGPRKRMKTNTRESVDDLSGWNTRKNNTVDKDLHHLVVCSTCFAYWPLVANRISTADWFQSKVTQERWQPTRQTTTPANARQQRTKVIWHTAYALA
jgi:hypothetical protein